MSRWIDADALPRHGQRGGLVHWKDIAEAPSIDIEPKRGKWIKRNTKCEYKCSECGKIVFADDQNELNFCCSCGAEMREREGE